MEAQLWRGLLEIIASRYLRPGCTREYPEVFVTPVPGLYPQEIKSYSFTCGGGHAWACFKGPPGDSNMQRELRISDQFQPSRGTDGERGTQREGACPVSWPFYLSRFPCQCSLEYGHALW